VTDLQEQAAALHARIRELETHCTTGPGAAPVALRELKDALKPEQLQQLTQWLIEAQGDNHVLARYERGAAVPPPSTSIPSAATAAGSQLDAGPHPQAAGMHAGASAPITIGGGTMHWRGGANISASPMESDEDSSSYPCSRSHDDIEGARSILNLNSPNGFHPMVGAPPPISFSLPTASSMLPFPAHHGTSMLSSSVGGARHGFHPPSSSSNGVPSHPPGALSGSNPAAGSS